MQDDIISVSNEVLDKKTTRSKCEFKKRTIYVTGQLIGQQKLSDLLLKIAAERTSIANKKVQ